MGGAGRPDRVRRAGAAGREPLSNAWARRVEDIHGEAGRAWLDDLPSTVGRWAERWALRVDPPFPDPGYAWVAPALREDGTPAVLKLGVPGDPALAREAAALVRFGGRGTVRLLEADPEGGALLLERALPGDRLTTVVEAGDDDRATLAAADVIEEILSGAGTGSSPAGGEASPDGGAFLVGGRSSTREMSSTAGAFPGAGDLVVTLDLHRRAGSDEDGSLPGDVLSRARTVAAGLLDDAPEPSLLHGDLHHGNLLRATRRPWLAVDPAGVLAEPEWEVGALLRNPSRYLESLGPARLEEVTARRVDLLVDRLSLDRDRVLGWGYVQAVLAACWEVEDHGGDGERWLPVATALEALAG